jgi:hypothetical protein
VNETFDPDRAYRTYRGNVEAFDEASPMLLLIGEHMVPILLDLPDDSPELVAPEVIRLTHGLLDPDQVEPLSQVVLSVEAEVMNRERPFAGTKTAVVIYSAGADEFRAVIPFARTAGGVVWDEDHAEVMAGPSLDRDPILVAMRWLIGASR